MDFSKHYIAIPPGATIKEQLETWGIEQKEFALRMGMSEKHISQLINGKVTLTVEVALKLESVLGLPVEFWLKLESLYREQLARVEDEQQMEKEAEIVKQFPYSVIAELGWLPRTRKVSEKIVNLRKYFEIANLELLPELSINGIAFRSTERKEVARYKQMTWAYKAKKEARAQIVDPIDLSKLKDSLGALRALTLLEPEVFEPELKAILASCGVVLVLLPHVKGSFLHGASFKDGAHIVLGLTLRGKYADKFWFSLFHELHHILAGDIKTQSTSTCSTEEAADLFAQNTLISPEDYQLFVHRSKEDIQIQDLLDFARQVGVQPGIIVGRLQNDGRLRQEQFNELKIRYTLE